MNRRNFLKASALTGGAIVAGSALANPVVAEASGFGVTHYDTIDDMVTFKGDVVRYDMYHTAFVRAMFAASGLLPALDDDDEELRDIWNGTTQLETFPSDKAGYTQLDRALEAGIGATEALTGSGAGRTQSGDSGMHEVLDDGTMIPRNLYGQTSASFCGTFDVAATKWEFDSPDDAAYAVKKTAKLCGADLVGIAPVDERFIYNSEVFVPKDLDGNVIMDKLDGERPVEFSFTPKSVIVMAFEMDYESYKAQPSWIGGSATTQGYALMAEVSLRVATFLRELGYNTRHCGNDTAMSVPLAIEAGLGEFGRNGLLITEEYGPRVRLAKIYTDLEMTFDKPKSFGVREFCAVCQLCSDNCPSKAIDTTKYHNDPTNVPKNGSSIGWVEKWQNNAQKCLISWNLTAGGAECGLCITVCPYNKIEFWHHDLAKVITRIPVLNNVARYFDEFFGYGGVADDQTIADFWYKTI